MIRNVLIVSEAKIGVAYDKGMSVSFCKIGNRKWEMRNRWLWIPLSAFVLPPLQVGDRNVEGGNPFPLPRSPFRLCGTYW